VTQVTEVSDERRRGKGGHGTRQSAVDNMQTYRSNFVRLNLSNEYISHSIVFFSHNKSATVFFVMTYQSNEQDAPNFAWPKAFLFFVLFVKREEATVTKFMG
jgi:hypothetical protein